jgi:hypothetical protein
METGADDAQWLHSLAPDVFDPGPSIALNFDPNLFKDLENFEGDYESAGSWPVLPSNPNEIREGGIEPSGNAYNPT